MPVQAITAVRPAGLLNSAAKHEKNSALPDRGERLFFRRQPFPEQPGIKSPLFIGYVRRISRAAGNNTSDSYQLRSASDQGLVEGKEGAVYLEDIIAAPGDEILDYKVKFQAVGEGIARLGEQGKGLGK